MNRPPSIVRAFTLIELMLSIALGSIVIYTAFAGFRVATQAITAANRLSLENALMRAGYFEAQRQVDFWTEYDDPDLPIAQRYQTSLVMAGGPYRGDDMKGLPFTPMKEFTKSINPPWRTFPIWPVTTSVPKLSTLPQVNSSATAIINQITPINITLPSGAISTLPKDSYWEQDMGWDATYAWAPHDPRTWNRANLRDKVGSGQGQLYEDPSNPGQPYIPKPSDPNSVSGWGFKDDMANAMPPQWYGRYQIFSQCSQNSNDNIEKNIGVLPYNIVADPNVYSPLNVDYDPTKPESQYFVVNYDNYPREGVRTWFPRQMSALFGTMGYASIIEYLPAGSSYTIYTNYDKAQPQYWQSRASLSGGSPPVGGLDYLGYNAAANGWFANNDNQYNYSRSAYSNTYLSSVGFINPRAPVWSPNERAPTSGVYYKGDLPALVRDHFTQYATHSDTLSVTATSQGGKEIQSRLLLDSSGYREPLMNAQPAIWPMVSVGVARYIKNVHHVALSKVSVMSPLTGNTVELSWGALGTSLRGARQQRNQNLTMGWARWDNAAGSVNDKHLDLP